MKKLLLIFSSLLLLVGTARSQNLNVTLADQLSYGSQALSNLWHWRDPQDGKEYALVGGENGMSIVDVTNPANVSQVTQIPGPACTWREIRTNGNYAYITTECGTVGLQIVDLTNLPGTNLNVATWTPTISGTALHTIHALQIDKGRIYLYGSNVGNKGAIIADIATNPMAPVYLGKYDPRYVHDGYVRNDTLYAGHIYDGECAVVNMSNPNNQTPITTFTTPGNFTHNTWLSGDSKTLFTTDEVNDSYLASFDVSNLGNVTELDRIQSNPGSNSVVHNTYIIKKNGAEYAVTSWYKDGFTIVDVTRPKNMVQVGNYDTAPTASGSGMNNDWGVDPFLPSGVIIASDMSNGLFVCNPTYVRACYLEGQVKDCGTGNPISGYTVTVQMSSPQSDANVDVTDATGSYAVGVSTAGTYTVTFAKTGSPTLTYTVNLSAGNVTALNPTVNCPPFTLTGKVYNNFVSNGVPFANVRIQSGSYVRDTVTNSSGNFTIPNFPAGTYEVVAGKWNFMTNCLSGVSISSSSGPVNIGIATGIYDDFTWDWGWTESGSATTGKWERGDPKGTMDSGNQANPSTDATNDCSLEAYVTGNTGSTGTDDDVDGGDTKLTSPYFNLTSYTNPYIYYTRWFYNSSGTNPNDSMVISIENGSTTKALEKIGVNSASNDSWLAKSFKVSSYIAKTATMRMTIRAVDLGSNNIVEGGFDKFYVLDSGAVSVDELSFDDAEVVVYPNPFHSSVNVKVANHQAEGLVFIAYDVSGRVVLSQRLQHDDDKVERGDLQTGFYFYKVTDGDTIIGTGKLVVQ